MLVTGLNDQGLEFKTSPTRFQKSLTSFQN